MITLNPYATPKQVRLAIDLEAVVQDAQQRGYAAAELVRIADEARDRGEDVLDALKRHIGLQPEREGEV